MEELDYSSSIRNVTIVSIVILMFSSILLVDSFLPSTQIKTTVISRIAYSKGRKHPRSVHGVETPEGRIPLPYELYYELADGDSITIDESPIVHFARCFYFKKTIYPQSANVYMYNKIPLFVILFGSLICLIKRKDTSGLIYFIISITMLFSILLFFFFIDDIYVAAS